MVPKKPVPHIQISLGNDLGTIKVPKEGLIMPAFADGATPVSNHVLEFKEQSLFVIYSLEGTLPSLLGMETIISFTFISERKWSIESWKTSDSNKVKRKTPLNALPGEQGKGCIF